jgi:hypothetical protein
VILNQSDEPIHNYPIPVHTAMVRDEEHVKPYDLTLLDLESFHVSLSDKKSD